MFPVSLFSLRNVCRMCGERYDEESKSIDIYEKKSDPDNTQCYADLMRVHLDLQPRENDGKPRRIGETCAKLLDEWTDFRKKILETQKELLKLQQSRLQRMASASDDSESNDPPAAKPSTSRVTRKRRREEEGESSGVNNSATKRVTRSTAKASTSKKREKRK